MLPPQKELSPHARWRTHDLAFSPDGRYLAVVGDLLTGVRQGRGLGRGEAWLWNLASGKPQHRFRGFAGIINCLAFSPDGKWLLAGLADGSLDLRSTETGQLVRRLGAHGDEIRSVAISPDGALALSASSDPVVKLWDLERRRQLRDLAGHRFGVRTVAFSPDGARAYSGGDDQTIRVWDPAKGAQLGFLNGGVRGIKAHLGMVKSLAVLPDGRALSGAFWDGAPHIPHSLSGDAILKLWDLETRMVANAHFGSMGVKSKSLRPVGDGSAALYVEIQQWEPRDNRTGDWVVLFDVPRWVSRYRKRVPEVEAIAVSPEGRLAALSTARAHLHLWDVERGETVATVGIVDGNWGAADGAGRFDRSADFHHLRRIGADAQRVDGLLGRVAREVRAGHALPRVAD
jgi:WD40 repeat protein